MNIIFDKKRKSYSTKFEVAPIATRVQPLGFGRTRGSGYKGLPKVLRFGVSLVMASCSACQVGLPRSRLAWIWLGCCTDVDFESTACVRVL